jgi:polyisoprenoid-binding protein YceI
MKTIKNLILIVMIVFSYTTINAQTKQIKTAQSNLEWKGYKLTGSHKGIINIKSGSLTFKDDKLTEGEFTIDMTTLKSTDLTGSYKTKLEGHLKSDDFFGINNHPTAHLVITDVKSTGKNSYEVTGDLTIKGITNSIEFDMSIYGSKANATLKIDRTKYNIRYGSASFFNNLKDKVIYDEFDLVVDLEF